MAQYIFDGSWVGLLCCVFDSYAMKTSDVKVIWDKHYQPSAFDHARHIINDREKAERVWKGFMNRTDKITHRRFYYAYLSELPEVFQHLFSVMCYVFKHEVDVSANYGNDHILKMAQIAKSVSREKHRMEAFVRFKKASDGLFYAIIKPDFNVLPLIQRHFRDRYADQDWLIYDEKRNYGLYFDQKNVTEVNIDFRNKNSLNQDTDVIPLHDEKEALYDQLWKDYFKATNIVERKNTKLHLQHVPKRYWRYLNEKF